MPNKMCIRDRNYTELGVYVEDIDKHYRIKDNSIYGEMIHSIYNWQQHPLEDKAIKYGKQAVNLIKVSAYSCLLYTSLNTICLEVS